MALTLFMYHRILPREYPGAISAETFERQLDHLARHYRILRADEIEGYITGELRVKGDCAGLSFDDAWADNLFYAEPILRRRGLSALLAVSASRLHDGPVRQGESDAVLYRTMDEAQAAACAGDLANFTSPPVRHC